MISLLLLHHLLRQRFSSHRLLGAGEEEETRSEWSAFAEGGDEEWRSGIMAHTAVEEASGSGGGESFPATIEEAPSTAAVTAAAAAAAPPSFEMIAPGRAVEPPLISFIGGVPPYNKTVWRVSSVAMRPTSRKSARRG